MRNVVDLDSVRELLIYVDNCRAVEMGTTRGENIPGPVMFGCGREATINLMIKHIIKGDYNDEGALKAWRKVFDFTAQVYTRIEGNPTSDNGSYGPFNVATRNEATRQYVETFRADWHNTAVAELSDKLLMKALPGIYYIAEGEIYPTWQIAPENVTDRQWKKIGMAYQKLNRELLDRAAKLQDEGKNHHFIRCVWQRVVFKEIDVFMRRFIAARQSKLKHTA